MQLLIAWSAHGHKCPFWPCSISCQAAPPPFLRPDGKTQVTVGYGDSGAPSIVDTILLSTQHDPDVSHDAIETALADLVVMPVL